MTTTKSNAGWTTDTRHLGAASRIAVSFGLYDSTGREVGCSATIEHWEGCAESNGVAGYVYRLGTLRDGATFGASMGIRGARRAIRRATIEEAQRDAEAAIEKTRKAAAKKYGATIEETQAAKAAQSEKRSEKVARWLAEYHAAKAAPVAEAVETAPAPVAVEAPALKVEVEIEVDQEITRFRAFRGPDGEIRFRTSEAAPAEAAPVPKQLPRCRNCGATFDPAVEGVADVFVACGECRHGQLEPGEPPDCACHRDPTLFA